MSSWSYALTNKGRQLQAKAQAGAPLVYTRMAVGSGTLSGQSLEDMSSLITPVKDLTISRLKRPPGSTRALIGATLTNQDVTTGFYLREVGIFATDPDIGEILYMYANAGSTADYITPKGDGVIEKAINMNVFVGAALSITANIDESLVYVTKDELNEAIAGITIPDASLTVKGKVQLSNATNSSSETLAATPKAVKSAYDAATAAQNTANAANSAAATAQSTANAANTAAATAQSTANNANSAAAAAQNSANAANNAVGPLSSLLTGAKSNTVAAINELFTNVSDGKNTIASAIIGKGVPASGSDTFAGLAGKIGQIVTGKRFATGTAAVSNRTASATGLSFAPKIIVFFTNFVDGSRSIGIMVHSDVVGDQISAVSGYTATGLVGFTPVFTANGFTADVYYRQSGSTYWVAFEF